MRKVYAIGAVAGLFVLVLFPLWPMKMRLGVWYLSMGMLGLIGLFFVMAIFRLILFAITMFAVPPGLWLYPNLFEDVGFFDSFRPLWGWQEVSYSFLQPVPFALELDTNKTAIGGQERQKEVEAIRLCQCWCNHGRNDRSAGPRVRDYLCCSCDRYFDPVAKELVAAG